MEYRHLNIVHFEFKDLLALLQVGLHIPHKHCPLVLHPNNLFLNRPPKNLVMATLPFLVIVSERMKMLFLAKDDLAEQPRVRHGLFIPDIQTLTLPVRHKITFVGKVWAIQVNKMCISIHDWPNNHHICSNVEAFQQGWWNGTGSGGRASNLAKGRMRTTTLT